MPFRPGFEGERPTLGFAVLDWIIDNLAAPDRGVYEPFTPTQEQADFTVAFYELDPVSGRRLFRRGVLSRARGWGKSPFVAALALAEGLAPVVWDGWDAAGRPVGVPWSRIRTPLVQLVAASEAQTANSWSSLLEMLECDAPALDNYPGLEPLNGFVNLPRGKIRPVTTSSTSLKGARPVFVACDQTEQWTAGNGAVDVYDTIANNVYKVGGSLLETPNAFTPGLGSQAERTAAAAAEIATGRNRKLSTGMFVDHREAPADTDLSSRESLIAGLRVAYGDSSGHPDGCVLHDPPCKPGWVDLGGICERIWQTDVEEQLSRADWLNQITHAPDSWLSGPEWAACAAPWKRVDAGDIVALGFDGSRGRARGKPDATALVGCRVTDGHLFEVGVWEAPDAKSEWDSWSPPVVEIEAAIQSAFDRWVVAGFYCDPARDWRSHVDAWEARFSGRVQVKASTQHPFEWWMLGGQSSRTEQAITDLEGAIRNRDVTHSGSDSLTRHMLAARRRLSHGKLRLDKDNDYSSRKIDAAVAAVLAFRARSDAVSRGLTGNIDYVPPRLVFMG